MAKNCLNKIIGSRTVECTISPVGVKNIYLMYASDVTFTEDRFGSLSGVTFATGAFSYLIEGYKQNIQLTTSVLSTDASQKLAVSVSFKTTVTNLNWLRSILIGSFYVMVEYQSGVSIMVGAQAPLECSGFDYDSNGNAGLTTITLSAPEGSAGNYMMSLTGESITTIKSKVGV